LPSPALDVNCFCNVLTVTNHIASIGIGLDSTTVYTASALQSAGASQTMALSCSYGGTITTGFHYLQRLEYSDTNGSNFYFSTTGLTGGNGLISTVFN
jgi:hypothetical protein